MKPGIVRRQGFWDRWRRELFWMKIPTDMPHLNGFRFPRDVIAYSVWVYRRLSLSAVDIENIRAERGVIIRRETDRLG